MCIKLVMEITDKDIIAEIAILTKGFIRTALLSIALYNI